LFWQTNGRLGLPFRPAENWQQEAGEYSDDCYDDKQFNQGEAAQRPECGKPVGRTLEFHARLFAFIRG